MALTQRPTWPRWVHLPLAFAFLGSAFSVNGQVLVRVGDEVTVNDALYDKSKRLIFFATSEGLFSSSEGKALYRRKLEPDGPEHELYSLANSGGTIWIGGDDGLFRLTARGYERVDWDELKNTDPRRKEAKPHLTVLRMATIPNESDMLWIWAGKDVVSVDTKHGRVVSPRVNLYPNTGEEIAEEDYSVTFLGELDGQLFLGTKEDLYTFNAGEKRFRATRPFKIPGTDRIVSAFRNYMSDIKDLYIMQAPVSGASYDSWHLRRITETDNEFIFKNVIAMGMVERILWFSTQKRVMEVVDGAVSNVPVTYEGVKIIAHSTEYQWLVSANRVYRRQSARESFQPLAIYQGEFQCEQLLSTDHGVWLFGVSGAFLIHENVKMEVRLNVRAIGNWRFTFLAGRVRPTYVSYVNIDGEPALPQENKEGKFKIYLEADRREFEKNRGDLDYYAIEDRAEYKPPGKLSDISIGVRNPHGSVQVAPTAMNVVVIPQLILKFFILYSALIFVVPLFLVLSVMSPWIRLSLFFYFAMYRMARVYPIVGMFFSPSADWMRGRLRGIFRRRWCSLPSAVDPIVLEELGRLERSPSRWHEVESPVSKEQLFEAIVCCMSGPFARTFPAIVDCEHYGSEEVVSKVRERVCQQLHHRIRFSTKTFCKKLFDSSDFVFIFALERERKDIADGLSDFFFDERQVKKDYMIWVPVSSRGVKETSEIEELAATETGQPRTSEGPDKGAEPYQRQRTGGADTAPDGHEEPSGSSQIIDTT